MQAFALDIVVITLHLEAARWLCWKLIAVSMLGVFVDTIYPPEPSNLALLLIRAGFQVSWSAWQKRHTATQPHSHRCRVGSGRLQLSCFQLGVRGPRRLALLAGGLGISTEAQQPLELKRNARDRIMI